MLTEFDKVRQFALSFVKNSNDYGIYIFAKIFGDNQKVINERGYQIITAEKMNTAKLRLLKEGSERAEPLIKF